MILSRTLAETFTFYAKAQIFHWNVTGPNFPQYHKLFGDIYTDAISAVDAIAEHIRASGEMAPTSLADLVKPASIKFTGAESADEMLSQLAEANTAVLTALRADLSSTTDPGLENYLEARIDTHAKWGWMLTASIGTRPAEKPSTKSSAARTFLNA